MIRSCSVFLFASVLACSAPAPLETPSVLASTLDAFALRVDGDAIFYTTLDPAGCAIWSVPAAGGAPTHLSDGGYDVQDLALDDDAIYWTDFVIGIGGIRKVSRAGGDAVTVISAEGNPWLNPHHLVVADGWIYFTNSGSDAALPGVMKIRVDGGDVVTLAGGGEPDEIAVDETSVYWTDSLGGAVDSVPRDGGATTVLASGQTGAASLALDAPWIYWTTPNAIHRAPLAGGATVDLASSHAPHEIATDGSAVYWFDAPHDSTMTFTLMKLDLATNDVTPLAASDTEAYGLALAGSSVVWTVTLPGSVDSAAK